MHANSFLWERCNYILPNCSQGKESGLLLSAPKVYNHLLKHSLMSGAFWCLSGPFPGNLEGGPVASCGYHLEKGWAVKLWVYSAVPHGDPL